MRTQIHIFLHNISSYYQQFSKQIVTLYTMYTHYTLMRVISICGFCVQQKKYSISKEYEIIFDINSRMKQIITFAYIRMMTIVILMGFTMLRNEEKKKRNGMRWRSGETHLKYILSSHFDFLNLWSNSIWATRAAKKKIRYHFHTEQKRNNKKKIN